MHLPHRHLHGADQSAVTHVLQRWSTSLAARAFVPHRAERLRAREELRRQRTERQARDSASRSGR